MSSESLIVHVDTVCWIFFALVVVGAVSIVFAVASGYHSGRCIEMCRPAKFDADQEVNDGCLCIGSDKVLRFKQIP